MMHKFSKTGEYAKKRLKIALAEDRSTAGIDSGFWFSASPADRAIVVTTPHEIGRAHV